MFTGGEMAASDDPPMMPLRVTRNEKIADGIHLLEFRDTGGKPLPEFSAGAHITIRVPNGLLRKYSLCNDPAERNRYQVAVKREVNGRGGSCNLIDNVKAGDELIVAAPINDFKLPPRAQDFLFVAGGHGIHGRVERAGIHWSHHHSSRPGRSELFTRPQAHPGRAQEPRAPLLLRTTPADGGGARHDRPLVFDRGAFRSLQRGGNT
jgi:hypothetical protein